MRRLLLTTNEDADAAAKEGATLASSDRELCVGNISLSEAKTRLKRNANKKWQYSWVRNDSGRCLASFDPNKRLTKIYKHRETETKVFRMILQHNRLEENMHKLYPEANVTPLCECGYDIGTVEHYLLHCSTHAALRLKLYDEIELGYHTHKTPAEHRKFNLKNLLGLNDALNPETKKVISTALENFLVKTHKRIKPVSFHPSHQTHLSQYLCKNFTLRKIKQHLMLTRVN